jgi:hypothetical protein
MSVPASTNIKSTIVKLLASVLAAGALAAMLFWGLGKGPYTVLVFSIRGFLVALLLAFGGHELGLLFRRPAKNMGTGFSRVWAVARTTCLEAWAGRVWLLPVLWLIVASVLMLAARPFDESERMGLYVRTLLSTQEVLLLIMMFVMACISLPRERERKIVITNASKPLSRLEIVLGKMVGFAAVSAGALALMGLASLIILLAADRRLRSRALENYQIQQQDYRYAIAKPQPGQAVRMPNESLLLLHEQGSLFAYNFIKVPSENFSILGSFDTATNPPTRWIRGGSYEKISYRFSPRIIAPENAFFRPVGIRPRFEFFFPANFRFTDSRDVKINVSAYCSQSHRVPPARPQEKVLTLDAHGAALWEPDNPDELFTPVDDTGQLLADAAGNQGDNGEVTVEVRCTTPDVLLQVLEGAAPDANGNWPADAEFNVVCRPEPRGPLIVPPLPNPVTRGFERYDRQEVAGPKAGERVVERAIYRFAGGSLRNVPVDAQGNFTLTVQLETHKAEHPERPTHVNLDFFSTDRPGVAPYQVRNLEIQEKRVMHVAVPASSLGDPDPAKRGDMYVAVGTFDQGHSLSLIEDSVRIELPQTFFFINLLQSEAVIFLEAVLLIVVCVMCSVRLGWPIAMLCAAVCLFFGYFVDFIASLQNYGGLMALNYRPTGYNPTVYHLFDQAANVLWKVMAFISALAPDFTIFRPAQYIANLQHMPWIVLGWNLFNTVVFALPCLALAFLFFRKQELG